LYHNARFKKRKVSLEFSKGCHPTASSKGVMKKKTVKDVVFILYIVYL